MDENDFTRQKAEALVAACNTVGLQARLHWDRSPWCCQVSLVDDVPAEDFNEYSPSIFFMLEDSDDYFIMGHGDNSDTRLGLRWHGQIQIDRERDDQSDLYDFNINLLERTWLGDTELDSARKIAVLVSMIEVSSIIVAR